VDKNVLKQKITHEVEEFLFIFLVTVPIFLGFTTYRMLLVSQYGSKLYYYGIAVVNALVLSKIILIGELGGLGKRYEDRVLLVSTLHKSAVFALFYVALHILEGAVRELVHGQNLSAAFYSAAVSDFTELAVRAVVMFFASIPIFALRETRRVVGPDTFRQMFLGRRSSRPARAEHTDQPLAGAA
jgi:hypothetical protein